jgi:hypothetical protein
VANPPRKKGTAGETELLGALDISGLTRTPASSTFDLHRPGPTAPPVRVLATRPDRGQWLFTVDLETFKMLLAFVPSKPLEIEVKRYRRFSLHSIFRAKFGYG